MPASSPPPLLGCPRLPNTRTPYSLAAWFTAAFLGPFVGSGYQCDVSKASHLRAPCGVNMQVYVQLSGHVPYRSFVNFGELGRMTWSVTRRKSSQRHLDLALTPLRASHMADLL